MVTSVGTVILNEKVNSKVLKKSYDKNSKKNNNS